MIVGGFSAFNAKNLTPFIPKATDNGRFGMSGIFRGATSAFFGYIGYDEVCFISPFPPSPFSSIVSKLCLVFDRYAASLQKQKEGLMFFLKLFSEQLQE